MPCRCPSKIKYCPKKHSIFVVFVRTIGTDFWIWKLQAIIIEKQAIQYAECHITKKNIYSTSNQLLVALGTHGTYSHIEKAHGHLYVV